MAVTAHLIHRFTGVDFFQHVEVHVMTQLVIQSYLSYAKGHQEAPFMWHRQSILRTVCHIWTSFSYLNGIGPLRSPSGKKSVREGGKAYPWCLGSITISGVLYGRC